jgi:hypothetical protein
MITAQGYSKDTSIMPEGIVITFGQKMIAEQGGLKTFLQAFQKTMSQYDEGTYWMHTCPRFPTIEADHIYIVVANRLYGRVYCGGFHRNHQADVVAHGATGQQKLMDKPFIILSGPFQKCPFKRTLRGFQGFRYATKLF